MMNLENAYEETKEVVNDLQASSLAIVSTTHPLDCLLLIPTILGLESELTRTRQED